MKSIKASSINFSIQHQGIIKERSQEILNNDNPSAVMILLPLLSTYAMRNLWRLVDIHVRKGAASPRAALNTGLAVQRLDFFLRSHNFKCSATLIL